MTIISCAYNRSVSEHQRAPYAQSLSFLVSQVGARSAQLFAELLAPLGVSPRAFDGQGNYSLGVKEQIIFPEIQYDQIDQVRGMDITITTTAKDDRHGRALLEAFNFPFRK